MQIKKLSLSWNKIGHSGAKALAICLWNIDELDLTDCNITECEELCNAIQSLERPVSYNLVSRHTVLKFIWYAGVRRLLRKCAGPCGKHFMILFNFKSNWCNYCVKILFHKPEATNFATYVRCRLWSCIQEWKESQCWKEFMDNSFCWIWKVMHSVHWQFSLLTQISISCICWQGFWEKFLFLQPLQLIPPHIHFSILCKCMDCVLNPGILTWVWQTQVKRGHSRETTEAEVGPLSTLQ